MRLNIKAYVFLALAAMNLCMVALLGRRALEEIRGGAAGSGEMEVASDPVDPKYVALTFDDGPNEDYTEHLLDGLREREVRATFFLTGKCVSGNESIVKAIAGDGHRIGIHCWDHVDLTRLAPEEAFRQLQGTAEQIERITGEAPACVRPPYGSWNDTLDEFAAEELEALPIFWTVDSLDWKLQHTDRIVQKVVKEVKDGSIILMHDEFETSVEAAFRIIDILKAKGYTFVTADELMVD